MMTTTTNLIEPAVYIIIFSLFIFLHVQFNLITGCWLWYCCVLLTIVITTIKNVREMINASGIVEIDLDEKTLSESTRWKMYAGRFERLVQWCQYTKEKAM